MALSRAQFQNELMSRQPEIDMTQGLKHAVAAHPLRIVLGAVINLAGYWALASHW